MHTHIDKIVCHIQLDMIVYVAVSVQNIGLTLYQTHQNGSTWNKQKRSTKQ